MQWSTVGDSLTQVGIYVSLIVGIPAVISMFKKPLNQRRRRSGTVPLDTNLRVRRRRVPSYRPPVTQPAVPCDMFLPEHFVSTVQCSGRIPLKRYEHERRGLTLWRALTREFLALSTSPKSAFAISSWQIHPHLTLGPDARCSRPGGFALRVTLRKGENR